MRDMFLFPMSYFVLFFQDRVVLTSLEKPPHANSLGEAVSSSRHQWFFPDREESRIILARRDLPRN